MLPYASSSAAAAADAGVPVAVRSDDEYSPLAEVVVGTAAGARIPDLDRSAWLNLYPEMSAAALASVRTGAFPPKVTGEADEDLDALSEILAGLGVTVHRPAPADHERQFSTPHWQAGGFGSYCPRDLALIAGRVIIQAPSPVRARMFELAGLRGLFQRAMLGGAAWIAAPAPELRDEMFPSDAAGRPVLGEAEPAFEAANVLRSGRELYYLVSGSGNEVGLRWLQGVLSAFGDYRVHPVRGVYPYTHIDSTISLLRPGLALLNPARIASADLLPGPLRSWEHLWCPPMSTTPRSPAHPLSSEWLGMNLLMVRPDLAIVDAAQADLITALERRSIDVIPHALRHARALGGGLHCVTLDLRRDTPSRPPAETGREAATILGRPVTAGAAGPLAARYAELRAPSARRTLEARSRVIAALRRHLHDTGHAEIDTPLLQRARPAPGRSFRTETRSLDPHIYLRSSPMHLRAMLTTGMDRVFEIGRTFRDEPADPTHSPEYSLVELYQAGADYQTLQATARELVTTAAVAATGGTVIRARQGTAIDLAAPWPAIAFYRAVSAAVGEEVTPGEDAARLGGLAGQRNVPVRAGAGADDIALALYDHLVEPQSTGPVIYYDFPAGPSPLARACPRDRCLAQKWDLVIDGREIATAYTEQSDPGELSRRLAPDGDRILQSEAASLDDDWLCVFAAGMPEAGGLCIGLERLLLALTGAASLSDVIPFPLPASP
jgi:elongation factor P--beta-lysine ligase/N-dimethylarginine dimethylaminohydrolase